MRPRTIQTSNQREPGVLGLAATTAHRAANLSSATDRTRPHRQNPFSIWALGILLLACATPAHLTAGAAQFTDDLFDQHEVATGSAQRQTIVPGFFYDGATADLAVLSVDESGQQSLRIYASGDGTWMPKLDAPLGPEVLFVDVANIGGRDRLMMYERGRLSWLDPDSAMERTLVEVTTSYGSGLEYGGAEAKGPYDEGEIPLVDITRDLNLDGRDDLVLPDLDGFWISMQSSNGSFSDPVKLGPPEPFRDDTAFDAKRTYGEVGISPLTIPWYLSRVHQMDYDQDGRSDLVFWNEDHFEVYLQDTRGLFSPVAERFTVPVPIDSDGAYSLMFGYNHKRPISLLFGVGKKMRRTVLQSLSDLNGDRVADLMTHSLEGRSVLRQRSRYEVRFGTPTTEGVSFSGDVSTAIQPRGRAGGIEFSGYSSVWVQDFDGDGQVDVMRGDVQIGAGAMIRALLVRSISMVSQLYRMEDGIFADRAAARREIRVAIDFHDGGRDAGFFPAVLVGDVNGDGRTDLLVGKSREELHVFLGVSGPHALARQPRVVKVAVPGDERNSWLVDLNKDGKQDVLMHQPSATEAHRVTLLIAR